MSTPVPAKIGKYDIAGIIGRGGMGLVYEARDPHLDRRVAIKTITRDFADNPDMLKRFSREAQSVGSLQHPNIVTVFELGTHEAHPYLVMEYLEGESLDAALSNRRSLTLFDKLSIVVHVCHGLGYAHRRGVTHRDIKPANIMLCKDGGVKIFDFGIARIGDQTLTRTGEVIGTLKYMAPEQVNSKATDFRVDIFSTGVVLYQLITSHLPFEGDSTASTILKIVHEPPPPLSSFLNSFPPEIEQITLRAMAKVPNDRYSSADEFAFEIENLLAQLKEDLINHEMQGVASFLNRGEVYEAKSSLLRVLKVDHQHSGAIRLLRDVQQRIQQYEVGKRILVLQMEAEKALADGQFDEALERADEALALDPNDLDLRQLNKTIHNHVARAEKLRQALNRAQSAQIEGNLEVAKQAADEALVVAPDDTEAKAFHRLIVREMEERSRQRQLEGYLTEARQELSSRRFTGALEILSRAQALDPNAQDVRSLIGLAVSGQQQERRRKEIEILNSDIQQALDRNDYCTAGRLADEGLASFPEERSLLKLKALAERRRLAEERKQFVDEQLAVARQMLEAGHTQDVKEQLEQVVARMGPEPRIQSMLAVVSDDLLRQSIERRKSDGLRNAMQALEDEAFDDAIQILEDLKKENTDDVNICALFDRARKERTEVVENALRSAEQELDLDRSTGILQEALKKSPQDRRLKEKLNRVTHLANMVARNVAEATKLEESGQYDMALAKWEMVRLLYPLHPGQKSASKRIRGLQEGARSESRQNWIDRIDGALRRCDFVQALALLKNATEEFPWDSDLMEMQERAESGARQRSKAEKLLSEAAKARSKQQWESGMRTAMRAYHTAPQDLIIRDQVIEELSQASRDAMQKNRQAAESILRQLAEIQPDSALSFEAEIGVQESKEEEAVASAINAAKRTQDRGDLDGALRQVEHFLQTYPEEPRLRQMLADLEERVEQRKEAARLEELRRTEETFIVDVIKRARSTGDLEQRVRLLEDALRKKANDARLLQELSASRELLGRVAALVVEAQEHDHTGQYDEALAKWEALAGIHPGYPMLQENLEQARGKCRRAWLEARVSCTKTLNEAVSSADYERAEMLLIQAEHNYPEDRELADIRKRISKGIGKRHQAEKYLDEATRAIETRKSKKALESFRKASDTDPDPQIRDKIVKGLLLAAEAVMFADNAASEPFLTEAERLDPECSLIATIRLKIAEQRHAHYVEQCLNAADRCIARSDLQSALTALDNGLFTYPEDPQLIAKKESIHRRGETIWEDPATTRIWQPSEPRASVPRRERAKESQAAEAWGIQADCQTDPAISPLSTAPLTGQNRDANVDKDDELNPERLEILERQLAGIIGPMAKVLVKRVAAKTTKAQIAYEILAASLDQEEDRRAFLAGRDELSAQQTHASSVPPRHEGAPASTDMHVSAPVGGAEISPAAVEKAGLALAAYLGPIAAVLARREAKQAGTIHGLYMKLAQHLTEATERERFLADSGIKSAMPVVFSEPTADASSTAVLERVSRPLPSVEAKTIDPSQ